MGRLYLAKPYSAKPYSAVQECATPLPNRTLLNQLQESAKPDSVKQESAKTGSRNPCQGLLKTAPPKIVRVYLWCGEEWIIWQPPDMQKYICNYLWSRNHILTKRNYPQLSSPSLSFSLCLSLSLSLVNDGGKSVVVRRAPSSFLLSWAKFHLPGQGGEGTSQIRPETEGVVGRTNGTLSAAQRRRRRQHFFRFKTFLLTSQLEEEEI